MGLAGVQKSFGRQSGFTLHYLSVTEYGNVRVFIFKTLSSVKKEIFIFLLPLDSLENVHSFMQQTVLRGFIYVISGSCTTHQSKYNIFHLPKVTKWQRQDFTHLSEYQTITHYLPCLQQSTYYQKTAYEFFSTKSKKLKSLS